MSDKMLKISIGVIGATFALLWLYELVCGRATFGMLACSLASIALYVAADAWCVAQTDNTDGKNTRARHVGKTCGKHVNNVNLERVTSTSTREEGQSNVR